MKKPTIIIITFILCSAAMLGTVLYSFWDTATESKAENRVLATLPSANVDDWFSGSFAENFENYLNDHLFSRNVIITAAQIMEGSIEREMEIKLVSGTGVLDAGAEASKPAGQTVQSSAAGTASKPEPTAPAAEPAGEKERPEPSGAEDGGSVVMLNDRILSTYYYDESNVISYVDTVSAFFDMFPDYVIKVNMLVPSRIAFEAPQIASLCDDQKTAIEEVYSRLDPLVYPVDAYSVLEANSGDLDEIFFRTDHHWTHFGAYLGAKAIFETLEQDFNTIDNYDEITGDPFLGYLYAQHQSESIKNNRDQLVCYFPKDHQVLMVENHKYDESGNLTVQTEPILDTSRSGYYSFAARSYAWLEIEGNNPEGPSVLLVGDSYCNALSTWIAENASRLVLVEPRNFDGGREGIMDLYQQYDFTEIIICDYVNVLESSYFISKIEDLTE